VHLPGPLERPAGATAWRTPASRSGSCSVGTRSRFPFLAGTPVTAVGSALTGLIIIGRATLLCRGCWCGLQHSFLSRLGRLLGRESGRCSAGCLLEPRPDLADVIEQRPALPRIAP
jgi:hypothetical protein